MGKLGDYVKIRTGKLDANASSPNGAYPFFTCAVEPLKIDSFSYDCECVLVAGNGDLNVKYYNGKFDAYQRTYIIESKDKAVLTVSYLYSFLARYVETLRAESIGGVIKYIKLGNLTEAKINLPSVKEQNKIVAILEKAKMLVQLRRQQLAALDELVKARFVEMFGDVEYNTKSWPIQTLDLLCSIGSSKRIYQNEQTSEGIPFWRVSDLVSKMDNGFADSNLFISEKKYDELKQSGLVPVANDILVTSRGTLGRCYIIKEDDQFYFQDGMISWLSNYSEKITPLYLQYLFMMPDFRKQIDSMQAGSTVAYLSIAMLKKLKVMVPSKELQSDFSNFVSQVDKTKSAVQKSLEKTQLLFDSLMQEYFG